MLKSSRSRSGQAACGGGSPRGSGCGGVRARTRTLASVESRRGYHHGDHDLRARRQVRVQRRKPARDEHASISSRRRDAELPIGGRAGSFAQGDVTPGNDRISSLSRAQGDGRHPDQVRPRPEHRRADVLRSGRHGRAQGNDSRPPPQDAARGGLVREADVPADVSGRDHGADEGHFQLGGGAWAGCLRAGRTTAEAAGRDQDERDKEESEASHT